MSYLLMKSSDEWVKRWHMYIAKNEDYFEGNKINFYPIKYQFIYFV